GVDGEAEEAVVEGAVGFGEGAEVAGGAVGGFDEEGGVAGGGDFDAGGDGADVTGVGLGKLISRATEAGAVATEGDELVGDLVARGAAEFEGELFFKAEEFLELLGPVGG